MTTTLDLKHINHYTNDHVTSEGVRICSPLYIDLSTADRKSLLNAVRTLCNERTVVTTPATQSGIKVESNTSENEITSFLGLDLNNLRNALFQRGGLSADLVFKLQAITSLTFVTEKDIAAAFKTKQGLVKKFVESINVN